MEERKEVILTIEIKEETLHGILDEDSMNFSAVGRNKYGTYTTALILKGREYRIITENTIEY